MELYLMIKNCARSKTIGCIVAYNPDELFSERAHQLACQVDRLIVVNNSPIEIKDFPEILVIENNNKGMIAGAINLAMEYSRDNGYRYIAIFDQDSDIPTNMVSGLVDELAKSSCAIVGPRYVNSATNKPGKIVLDVHGIPIHRWISDVGRPRSVFYLINSGSVMDLEAVPSHLKYDEVLALDLVDVDFCLTLKSLGLKVMIIPGFSMRHGIGNKNIGSTRLSPSNYSMSRFSGIFRNRIIFSVKWFRKFTFFILMEIIFWLLDFIRNVLFMRNRISYLKSCWKGLRDGILILKSRV